MATTTPRLVGAVLGLALLGTAGGVGAGVLTQPDRQAASAGIARPITVPQTTTPAPREEVRTPVPDNSKPLDVDELRFATRSFTTELTSVSEVSMQVPRGWRYLKPAERDDWVKYVDPTGKRWVRIASGFAITRPTAESMRIRTELLRDLPAQQHLNIQWQRTTTATTRDGEDRTYSTLAYTYLPPEGERTLFVLARWVGFGELGHTEVDMSVTGLPQDVVALMKILDRASGTVVRTDR